MMSRRTFDSLMSMFLALHRMTTKQQTPIKGDGTVSIDLGSKYAQQLGMENVTEYTEEEAKAAADAENAKKEAEEGKKSGGKKKKKNNKKKKK